jgi:hypothetical protein
MLEVVHCRTICFARLFRDFGVSDTATLLDGLAVTAIALDATIKQSTRAIAMGNHFLIVDLLLLLYIRHCTQFVVFLSTSY